MKNTTLFIIGLLLLSTSIDFAVGDPVDIDIDTLEIQANKKTWEEDGVLSFEYEGVNITIHDRFMSLQLVFLEMYGRDVRLRFFVPSEYMSPSVLDHIKTEDDVTIEMWTTDNDTVLCFDLQMHQMVTLEISKASIVGGQIRKNVHSLLNYVEYTGDAKGNEEKMEITIDKKEARFEVDNKHMVVQVKTSFFGWYYPIDDSCSSDVFYHVDDQSEYCTAVVHFKDKNPGDVKILRNNY